MNYLGVCELTTGVSKPDADAVAEAIRRVVAGRDEQITLAYQCVVPDVGPRWFEVRIEALGDQPPRHAVVAHKDITDRRKDEIDEQTRRALMLSLVDGISDFGIFTLDPRGIVQSWNTGATELLGYQPDEIIGKDYAIFFNDRDRMRGVPAEQLERAKQGCLKVEGWRVTRSGEQRFVFSSVYALRDFRTTLVGFAKVCGDATALRWAESQLSKAVVELQVRNKELEQFVYTVSHDLKTPLVTIAGFSSHARDDLAKNRTDRLAGFIDRIGAASTRMSATIDDLLKLSRLGRVVTPPEEIDAAAVIAQIASEMNDTVTSKGARVLVDPVIPRVFVDPTRFREIIENLLSNALKYGCPRPGMEIHVTGRGAGTAEKPMVELTVRDFGPGVPPESRSRIFGLFQRMDSRGEGTGVGLTIVKRIAELHDGDAWVEAPAAASGMAPGVGSAIRPGGGGAGGAEDADAAAAPGAAFVVSLPASSPGPLAGGMVMTKGAIA